MTAQKDLKKIIRARQQKTGESYTSARAHVLRERLRSTATAASSEARKAQAPHEIWIDQCDATLGLRERFGLKTALSYLIGEKFIMFLDASVSHPEFAAEVPLFVSWVCRNFTTHELKSYLGTLERNGISARLTQDDEVVLRRIGPRSRDPNNSIDRDLALLTRARDLLLAPAIVN